MIFLMSLDGSPLSSLEGPSGEEAARAASCLTPPSLLIDGGDEGGRPMGPQSVCEGSRDPTVTLSVVAEPN